jgi:translation initiation factor 2 subunit 1
MTKKRGFPMQGELVICTVKKLNPNSADVVLTEYQKEAMIHISEIVSGWVRNIKDHLKPAQTVVAKVMRVNEQDGYIALSVKRVDVRQEKEKLKEYNLDKKAEKMLEMAAKVNKKTLEKAYEEVGFTLQESFGSLFKAFKKSITSPDSLISRGISEEWVSIIKEIAEKNIEQKEFEFKAKAELKSYSGDGVNDIKELLKEAESLGLEVLYISAPEYLLKLKTKDAKRGERLFAEAVKKLESASNKKKIENKIEMIK